MSGNRAAIAWIALALSGCAPTAALMTPPPTVKPGTAVRIEARDGSLALQGTWAGRPVDLTVSRKGLRGATGKGGCSLDLVSTGIGVLSGPLGCPGGEGRPATSATGTLRLLGEAALAPEVLLPQFVLALLTTLP